MAAKNGREEALVTLEALLDANRGFTDVHAFNELFADVGCDTLVAVFSRTLRYDHLLRTGAAPQCTPPLVLFCFFLFLFFIFFYFGETSVVLVHTYDPRLRAQNVHISQLLSLQVQTKTSQRPVCVFPPRKFITFGPKSNPSTTCWLQDLFFISTAFVC